MPAGEQGDGRAKGRRTDRLHTISDENREIRENSEYAMLGGRRSVIKVAVIEKRPIGIYEIQIGWPYCRTLIVLLCWIRLKVVSRPPASLHGIIN